MTDNAVSSSRERMDQDCLVTAVTREAAHVCLRPPVSPPSVRSAGGCFQGTISSHTDLSQLYLVSWLYIQYSVKSLIIAQTCTCSPRLILTPPPGRERDETRTLMSLCNLFPDSGSVLNRSVSPGMPHLVIKADWFPPFTVYSFSCSEGLTSAPSQLGLDNGDNWTGLVTAHRSCHVAIARAQVRLGPDVWSRMMPTPELRASQCSVLPILAQADARRRIIPS